jgi:unsaturated chondroitin disaccharide hydrolase
MLEVPVSFYTANETLDQDIARHATAHCRTTRDRLVGDDGSASSVAEYRSDTASFTPGGDSNCSRNVGLALLGFSQVYGLTNAAEFLKVAERCAEYWLAHLPPDRLARLSMVDDSPSVPGKAQDLVASAIAACALLELAEQTRVKEHAVAYRSTGLAMLDALCQQGGQDVGPAARDTTPLLRVDDTHIQDWLGDFYFARALRLGQASSR